MAITIKNFATLIARIQYIAGDRLMSDHETNCIHDLVEAMQQSAPQSEPTKVDLVPLFDALVYGRKIDAIKHHRQLTGMFLKESKDEVEKLINGYPRVEPKKVGDNIAFFANSKESVLTAARKIIVGGDTFGVAYEHSTTVQTRKVIEALIDHIETPK